MINNTTPYKQKGKTMSVITATVPTRELVLGDIVEETYSPGNTTRKVVINLTGTSAVYLSEYGQQGRQAFTRKVKGQPVETTAQRIGHYDLGKDLLAALRGWRKLGELAQVRLEHGVYKGLPRLDDVFGYGPDEQGPERRLKGTVVETITLEQTGDRVHIVRHDNVRTYDADRNEVRVTSWGVKVLDPEHDFPFASLGWRYRDRETAEQVVETFASVRARGHDLEMAVGIAAHISLDSQPTVDQRRW